MIESPYIEDQDLDMIEQAIENIFGENPDIYLDNNPAEPGENAYSAIVRSQRLHFDIIQGDVCVWAGEHSQVIIDGVEQLPGEWLPATQEVISQLIK